MPVAGSLPQIRSVLCSRSIGRSNPAAPAGRGVQDRGCGRANVPALDHTLPSAARVQAAIEQRSLLPISSRACSTSLCRAFKTRAPHHDDRILAFHRVDHGPAAPWRGSFQQVWGLDPFFTVVSLRARSPNASRRDLLMKLTFAPARAGCYHLIGSPPHLVRACPFHVGLTPRRNYRPRNATSAT